MTLQPASVPPTPPAAPANPATEALPAARATGSKFSPSSGPFRLSRPRQWSRRTRILVAAAAALVLVSGVSGAYLLIEKPFRKTWTDLVPYEVRYGRLELKVVDTGQLESAKNSDIYCRVKARTQGNQLATTIKWIVDDGTHVRKSCPKSDVRTAFVWVNKVHGQDRLPGWVEEDVSEDGTARTVKVKDPATGKWIYSDLLAELDDSGLIEQLKSEKTTLETAQANKVQAEQALEMTILQNKSDIAQAEIDLELAVIDYDKYLMGDYLQQLQDLEGNIQLAESNLEMQRERAAWANRMVKKGYYTANQAEAEQAQLKSREFQLRSLLEQKRVLEEPNYGGKKRNATSYRSAKAQKRKEVDRIKAAALGKEVQSRADFDAKRSIWEQEKSKYEELVEEIKKCKLSAPQDGLVVYYVSDQARFGGGAQQSIIAQGEPVREGQKLMQIPDLDRMLVNTRVHEAMVARVHEGQPAVVRVDSFNDEPLKGRVVSVANTSSQLDWLSNDVRYYPTKVAINKQLAGLKPGMNAKVTIFTHDALEHVLLVPVEAVVGGPEMADKRKVFVLTPAGPQEREVTPGMSNEKVVQIKEGLEEGEVVVLNPQTLVGDKEKTRQPGSGLSSGENTSEKPADQQKQPSGAGPAGPASNGPGGSKGPAGARRGGRGGPGMGGPDIAGPGMGGPGMGGPGAGGFQMTPEMRKQMEQRLIAKFKGLPKEQRKAALEQFPEAWRGQARETLQKNGVEIPD